MLHVLLAGTLMLCVVGLAAGQSATPATDIPVRKVVLFSSGVGYFEHTGTVRGNDQTELRFKTDQINDVLKSLVLQDLGGGRIGTIVYPSNEPLSKTLRSFQVDLSGNPPLAALLNQLRGAEVEALIQGRRVAGTLLGVETREQIVEGTTGRVVQTHVMNIMAGGRIQAVELDQVQTLELVDDDLQREFAQALSALAQARDQDKKPVLIQFHGAGARQVRIGYVVETPVWKTSYRLIMPEEEGGDGYLQGWAIVENQTDNDWTDVDLALVSGRPISFRQDLYQPLYVTRPEVKPKLYSSLRPQTYDDGVSADAEADQAMRKQRTRGNALAAAPAAQAPAEFAMMEEAQAFDPAEGIASVAEAERVGELFQYKVPDVSLPRQRSAMLPIVTDAVEVERVSLYNESTLARHPLNGARLKNTSGKHLLQGPITVFADGSYAGDAQIDDLPPDQERFLSYAVDLDVVVQITNPEHKPQQVQQGKIVDGVLELSVKRVYVRAYTLENKGDRDKTIIVEHPYRSDAELVDTPEPMEKTDQLYRFKVAVPAGEQVVLKVQQEAPQFQRIALVNANVPTLTTYQTNSAIAADVRRALGEVISRRQTLVRLQQQVQQVQQERQQITADQDRIRENMKTVTAGSAYYDRLLEKLNDQETQIERLLDQDETLQQQLREAEAALRQYVQNLKLD